MEASIAQGLNVLEHSIYCCYPECEFFKCSNMKCLLEHLRECKAKHSANCVVCKELLALICRHSRFCYNLNCRIPYCLVMKDNMDYSEDSDVESVDDDSIKKEFKDNYRDAGSSHFNRTSMEPPTKKPRLESPSNVKNEFEFSASRSIPLPAFQPPSPTDFPSLAHHLTENTTQVEHDINMRDFDCQASTSGFQTHFPLNRLDDAYKLYYSDRNSNNRNFRHEERMKNPLGKIQKAARYDVKHIFLQIYDDKMRWKICFCIQRSESDEPEVRQEGWKEMACFVAGKLI